MQRSLCDKYGFDKTGREQRLSLLEFNADDDELALLLLQKVLHPCYKPIVDEFYEFIGTRPEMMEFIDAPDLVSHLKQTQGNYLETLGLNFRGEDYFENRLLVGIAHARIGLPLSYYFSAYRKLVELIVAHFPAEITRNLELTKDLTHYVNKIASLDMTLALDVYHLSLVQQLADSVDNLMDEKRILTTQVQRDSLTQLASRRYLLDMLKHEVSRAKQGKTHLSIAMADLDRFKAINDSKGHLVGDRVLKEVAHRSLTSIRDRDVIGRYGGEEFLMVFPETSIEVACSVAERIRVHIARTPVHLGEINIPITVSIGVVEYQAGEGFESFLKRADDAMYAAKKSGRNRVVSA